MHRPRKVMQCDSVKLQPSETRLAHPLVCFVSDLLQTITTLPEYARVEEDAVVGAELRQHILPPPKNYAHPRLLVPPCSTHSPMSSS